MIPSPIQWILLSLHLFNLVKMKSIDLFSSLKLPISLLQSVLFSRIIFLLVRAALDESRNGPQMTFTWLQGSSVPWLQSPMPWRYLGLDQPLPPLSHGRGVLRPCNSLPLTASMQPTHHSSAHGPCRGPGRSSPTTPANTQCGWGPLGYPGRQGQVRP